MQWLQLPDQGESWIVSAELGGPVGNYRSAGRLRHSATLALLFGLHDELDSAVGRSTLD
jgi:hypothetical protein